MKIKFVILTVFALFSVSVNAQDLNKYEKSTYIEGKDSLPYRILFPKNFDPMKKYPLILVLHGAGERGNDNEAQLVHGGNLFLSSKARDTYPAIVVFPQCPKDSYWSNVKFKTDSGKREFIFQKGGKPTMAMKALLGLAERLIDKPYINKEQLYVGGLSMGGMGTFELLRRMPKTFAAAFPICGGDNPQNVKKYKKTPLWIFHGADDDVVPVSHSEIVAKALQEKGAQDIKLTIYPGVKHNSWDNAFAEPQLLPWLFAHKK
ncbi:prolyl oligopeptidase family serine peptidase [Rubrolithibacter danxiaensis]|uniref:carboxylesterase family protein n=1 Tax=Rubrolithibacter danxiaensis TaxID=3390805 RepID=UPI003BF797A6